MFGRLSSMVAPKRVFAAVLVILACCLAPRVLMAQEAGSQVHGLSVGGLERSYRLYRPASLGRQMPAPLVIVIHGGFGSGSQAESSYNWDAQADLHGFVVAYPDGIRHSWNAGGICCGPALRENVDDVGFLTSLINAVSRSDNIDPRRVYLTGISNGAAMAYRYACEGSYPIAAIGPVAGSFSFSCAGVHPMSVMAIHGLDDRHIPFAGGQGTKGVTKGSWNPVPASIDLFRAGDSCEPPAISKAGPVKTEASKCAEGREVILVTVEGAGHQWPGGKARGIVQRILGADAPSTALDATSALWSFFRQHPARTR